MIQGKSLLKSKYDLSKLSQSSPKKSFRNNLISRNRKIEIRSGKNCFKKKLLAPEYSGWFEFGDFTHTE